MNAAFLLRLVALVAMIAVLVNGQADWSASGSYISAMGGGGDSGLGSFSAANTGGNGFGGGDPFGQQFGSLFG